MRVVRGYTLVELLVSLATGSVVLAAAGQVALAVRRFWFAEREALAQRQTLRTAAAILSAELRSIAPSSGDLLATSDTAVTLRAPRGLFQVCRNASAAAAEVLVRRDDRLAPADPLPGRDSVAVLVAAEADSGDHWVRAGLVDVAGAACGDGTAALRLALDIPGGAGALDSVFTGAAVRTFETMRYRLYADGGGRWWLGVRSWQGTQWSTTSPLAGPLLPRTGLELRFLDAAGAPAPTDSAVRAVAVTLRSVGATPIAAAGWRSGPRSDSLQVIVAPRNP